MRIGNPVAFSTQVTDKAEQILAALNPDEGYPIFEIELAHTMRRSFATGDAAAHIGEYPAQPSITLYARGLGNDRDRVLVGVFDGLLQSLVISKHAPDVVAKTAIELLGSDFHTVVTLR